MPQLKASLRVGIIVASTLLLVALPLRVLAATSTQLYATAPQPTVFITELQTAGTTASEEFIEFYNATTQDIDLADTAHAGKDAWKLQFYSATSTTNGTPDWTKPSATVSLTGVIPAGDYYELAATGYSPGGIDADQSYSARLADAGGGVQLVDVLTAGNIVTTTTHDRLQWKQVAAGQTLPTGVAPSPTALGSLQRLPNDNDEYINPDNTLTDFAPEITASPKDMWAPPVVPDPTPEAPVDPAPEDPAPDPTTPDCDNTPPVVIDNTGLLPPFLTELLPNPAAPLTDADDEYIELYNPNPASFDLKGYTLEVGTTTLHDFTFTNDEIVPANVYIAFYSADTHLALSNSGGQARLLDSAGQKIDETSSYGAAVEGRAWALGDGSWQWTTAPTPGAANTITAPTHATSPTTIAKATAASPKKAAAKTTTSKVKGATTTKTAKAKKTTKPKATKTVSAKQPIGAAATTPGTPIHPSILVAVAIFAVLYGAYEYRHDMANKFYQLRQYRTARRLARE